MPKNEKTEVDMSAEKQKEVKLNNYDSSASLKTRMTYSAIGNLIFSCWHLYLGFLLMSYRSSSKKEVSFVFLVLAGMQIIVGLIMLLKPKPRLYIADAAIFLFCAILNTIAIEMGASGWVKILVFGQFLMMVDCINRYRMSRKSKNKKYLPLVSEIPDDLENKEEKSLSCDIVVDEKHAGYWQNDQFVITAEQMQAVINNPDSFDNVIVEKAGSLSIGGGIGGEIWYLVLGRGAAILFDKCGENFFSVYPQDWELLISRRVLALKLVSGDAKGILSVSYIDACASNIDTYALLAWKCSSEKEFIDALAKRGENIFSLLYWAILRNRNPRPWLRWRPSIETFEDALVELSLDENKLEKEITRRKPTEAIKWLEYANGETRIILIRAIKKMVEQQLRTNLLFGRIFLGLGIVFSALTLMFNPWNMDKFIQNGFLIISGTAGFFLTVIGAIYLVQYANTRKKFKRETP